jgi:hypothetical protein
MAQAKEVKVVLECGSSVSSRAGSSWIVKKPSWDASSARVKIQTIRSEPSRAGYELSEPTSHEYFVQPYANGTGSGMESTSSDL